MFVDRAEIHVRGGDGGRGCVSFRRERFLPKGGPDGGNGGDGGSVILEASADVATLLDLAYRRQWFAENGRPGEGNQRAGRAGQDRVMRVPQGTLVYDQDTGILLKDLTEIGDRICAAQGGRGGMGNKAQARATDQTPRTAEPGTPGQERRLRLDLKLIADVGIVGLPNAGKSTLLARLSKARPKIADYPFTTLAPQLGIVQMSDYRRMVLADIPGLIEGAHEGVGLGDRFLRHIERTRVLLHLVEIAPDPSQPSPAEAYRVIRNELAKYSPVLASKVEIVAANKCDLQADSQAVGDLADAIEKPVQSISAAVGTGLPALTESLWSVVQAAREQEGRDDARNEPGDDEPVVE